MNCCLQARAVAPKASNSQTREYSTGRSSYGSHSEVLKLLSPLYLWNRSRAAISSGVSTSSGNSYSSRLRSTSTSRLFFSASTTEAVGTSMVMLLETSQPSSVSAMLLGATEAASPSESSPSTAMPPPSSPLPPPISESPVPAALLAASPCGAGMVPPPFFFFFGTFGGGMLPSSSAVGQVCSSIVGSYGCNLWRSGSSPGLSSSTTRSLLCSSMAPRRAADRGQGSGSRAMRAREKSPWPVRWQRCLHLKPGPRT
mmetsp:Transcript_50182/g.112723  ORF Transcript_50182/g.112723 Transcript_50182/m.112723 type:complete len:256 (+) Transcript_50182:831-1598(+)